MLNSLDMVCSIFTSLHATIYKKFKFLMRHITIHFSCLPPLVIVNYSNWCFCFFDNSLLFIARNNLLNTSKPKVSTHARHDSTETIHIAITSFLMQRTNRRKQFMKRESFMINALRIPNPPGPLSLTSHKDSSLSTLIALKEISFVICV